VKEVDLLEREKKSGEREGVLKHMDVKVCSPREQDHPNMTPHVFPVSAPSSRRRHMHTSTTN
jgi:hypothetical protein